MKKQQLLLLLIPFVLASCSCRGRNTSRLSRDTDDDIFASSSISGTSDESSDGSENSSSQEDTTPKEALVSDLKEENYNQFPINYLKKLNTFTTYKTVTTGQTISSIPILGNITQTIDVTAIKSDYSYLFNASSSSMYSSEHIAYYHNDKAVYKNLNESNYTTSTLEDYLNKYGTYPFETRIEGYKVTGDAVTSITQLEKDGDNYRFKMVLDIEKSTSNVRIQMKEFGQLDDYPVFSSIEMTLTVQNDYTPVKIELNSQYKATKIIETSCHQTYTVTFSNYNATIEIPNLDDSIKSLFD